MPAETESGRPIGRLSGLVIDTASHEVVQYAVRKSGALSKLLPRELLVDRRQVVSLGEDRLVVRDAAVEDGESESEPASAPAPEPSPGVAGLNRTAE